MRPRPPEPVFVSDSSPNVAATVQRSHALCIICVVFCVLRDPEEPKQTPASAERRPPDADHDERAAPGFNQISRLGSFIRIAL